MKYKNYPEKYRKDLDKLFKFPGFVNKSNFSSVKELVPHNLRKIGPADTSRKQVNCHGYTFGTDSWLEQFKIIKVIKDGTLKETNNPERGDIILYIEDIGTFHIKHSGIYISDDKVWSKWSNGPVFEHDILNVPFSYGSKIKFYKKTKQKII